MSKINLPNQKKLYQKLNNRLARYVGMVQAIYDSLNLEASKIAIDTEHTDGEFHFSDYPETKKRVDDLQSEFVNNISGVIFQGTSREWKESNLMQDLLADKVYKRYLRERDGEKQEVYYQTNNDALKAFQQRKDRGLNLSQKLWKQSRLYKEELETAISTAIERGTDAITLSKKISKYLNDFPSLQKDYTEKFGHASKAKDCEYRSIRLARSEINIAYRNAEQLRWQQMDFVVGYEIHLSNSHPKEDICDRLAGKYPKDFVWTGWHPNDLCYKTSILKDEDEFFDIDDDAPSRNEVTDVPDAFKEWVSENEERIKAAEKHNTLPYFLKDNKEYIDEIRKELKSNKSNSTETIEELKQRLGDKTPITLENLDHVENKGKKNVPATDEETHEFADRMRSLFERSDFGMNIPREDMFGQDIIDDIFSSGRFRNQLETGTSKGAMDPDVRISASQSSFGTKIEDFPTTYEEYVSLGKKLEKYGILMDKDILKQADSSIGEQYWSNDFGEVDGIQVRFKKDKVLTTFTVGDSLDNLLRASLTTNPLPYAGKGKWKDIIGASRSDIDSMSAVDFQMKFAPGYYVEVQYHGELTTDCIESVFVPESTWNKLQPATKKKIMATGCKIYSDKTDSKGNRELITL